MGRTSSENGSLEPRAFVAVKLGERSWVVDLPKGQLDVGSGREAGMRLESEELAPLHFRLGWDGQRLTLAPLDEARPTFLNGKRLDGAVELKPGDEIASGTVQLVVGVAVPPSTGGRRALTHAEFRERLYEEAARAARAGRPTSLVMIHARPGEGGRIAAHALASFRAGDVVGTYAHDELEVLLPDTGADAARAVIERLLTEAQAGGAVAGLAVAPEHGDNPERLLRAARGALGRARDRGRGIETPTLREPSVTIEPDAIDPAGREVLGDLANVADDPSPVLITGEASSGKALFARAMHRASRRRDAPFVVVACASLDEASEAAVLGAGEGSAVARASGGTLLLDEVGDLSPSGQALLARTLDGGPNVRVVATTHRALGGLVERGAFDGGLYERLSSHVVELPPLRNRPEDIIPLAERFAEEFGGGPARRLSPGALARLRSHPWPGNVLELRNAMERAVRLAAGGEILSEHLPTDVLPAAGDGRLREHVDSVERDAIVKALADSNHNQTHAAKRLGISRRALIYKMEKYGLKAPPGQARRSQPPSG